MKETMLKYILGRAVVAIVGLLACIVGLSITGFVAKDDGASKIFVLLFTFIAIAICFALYNFVLKPYKRAMKALDLFAAGYTIDDLYSINIPLSPEIQRTISRMEGYFAVDQMLESTRRQAEYLALQNQINPHFLYNALEGIRGEALAEGHENIANMTEALSTFFRYTISDVGHVVTLEKELQSVENYFIIQKFRFEDRFSLKIESPKDNNVLECLMPKLILQPIVENAIVHGIEPKIGSGIINIKIVLTKQRLLITISDNGVGICEDELNNLIDKLSTSLVNTGTHEKKERTGIALINVNNRLKLMYGEEYGVNIYSALGVGTDVEIALPRLLSEEESFIKDKVKE